MKPVISAGFGQRIGHPGGPYYIDHSTGWRCLIEGRFPHKKHQ